MNAQRHCANCIESGPVMVIPNEFEKDNKTEDKGGQFMQRGWGPKCKTLESLPMLAPLAGFMNLDESH